MKILRNQKTKALQQAIIHLKANKVAQGKIKSRRESPHSAMLTQMLFSLAMTEEEPIWCQNSSLEIQNILVQRNFRFSNQPKIDLDQNYSTRAFKSGLQSPAPQGRLDTHVRDDENCHKKMSPLQLSLFDFNMSPYNRSRYVYIIYYR